MTWDRISKTWREALANKLQERYGLDAEEAGRKSDEWMRWIGEQPTPPDEPPPSRHKKPKSRAAKRS
jgi:hypothetical protein